MSNLHDHSPGGNLIFAGEMEGEQYRLVDLSLYNNDDSDKPPVEANDGVHGNWVKVEDERGERTYLAAPGELIAELQRIEAEEGTPFEVTRCVKSGSKQTDPYEVNLEELEQDQGRLP